MGETNKILPMMAQLSSAYKSPSSFYCSTVRRHKISQVTTAEIQQSKRRYRRGEEEYISEVK